MGWIVWLEQHMFACQLKSHFGIDCPGCGLQRSVIALLKGDIAAGWHFYPPVFFILLTFLFTFLHLAVPLKHGAFIVKLFYIVSVIAIFTNYIYKIANNQLV